MLPDADRLWQAIEAGDPRFDGWVVCGVRTTGVYCRPSCPARMPKRDNVRPFSTAAMAQAAGYRACRRCRSDTLPGSPEWERRDDLVGRAMRLIADGAVDRDGVKGLAARLGCSERHVHRELTRVVGVGPLALARAQRAHLARILLETTSVSIGDAAFAAGFLSVRQFNETIGDVFSTTPRAIRARGRRDGAIGPATRTAIALRLPHRPPFDADGLLAFFARRAVRGVEEIIDGTYRRSLRLPRGSGVLELRPDNARYVHARYWLDDPRDLGAAIQRSRVLLDLDSDPQTVLDALGSDPILGDLVSATPGRRVAGHVDAHELAVRAVLGQQVSLSGAAALAARLVADHGQPLAHPRGNVTRFFPSADELAEADPDRWPMPADRRRALKNLTEALSRGDLMLDPGVDRAEAGSKLIALSGIGPWTAGYVALRGLGDRDVFLANDLGVRRALEQLGHDGRPRAAARLAEQWRPFRAYAMTHLWAQLPAGRSPTIRP